LTAEGTVKSFQMATLSFIFPTNSPPHTQKKEYTQKKNANNNLCSDVISATVAFSKNCFHFLSFIWLHIATVQPFYVLAYIHKLNKTWIIYQYLIKLNICHFVDPDLYIGKTRI